MEYKSIISSWQKKSFDRVYFLTGDEEFFIDQLVDYAEANIIPEEQRDFCQEIYYGRDVSGQKIAEIARLSPLGANEKLMIVKESQEIKDKDWEGIEKYLLAPSPKTILILSYKHKKPDGRLNWVKTMKTKSIFYESAKLKENQVPSFIKDQAKELGMHIDDGACQLMSEYLGNNLNVIYNELEKIQINLPYGSKINVDTISNFSGVNREFNVFTLQDALNHRNTEKAMKIVKNMATHIKNNPIQLVTASLYSYFSKLWMLRTNANKPDHELMSIAKIAFATYLNDYKSASRKYTLEELSRNLNLCREYDLRSKGLDNGSTEADQLMVEMICKFLIPIH